MSYKGGGETAGAVDNFFLKKLVEEVLLFLLSVCRVSFCLPSFLSFFATWEGQGEGPGNARQTPSSHSSHFLPSFLQFLVIVVVVPAAVVVVVAVVVDFLIYQFFCCCLYIYKGQN